VGSASWRSRGSEVIGLGLGLGLGLGSGCLQVDPFSCRDDVQCVLDGRAGRCQPLDRTCVYPDDACDTRWSTASGECRVPPPTGSTGSDSGTSADPSSSSGSGTIPDDASGPDLPLDPCAAPGSPGPLAAEGSVSASSVFGPGFEPERAIDGDPGTSWLSAGIDLEGTPATFDWVGAQPRCITRVAVIGNAMHDDPEYRENYGFRSMVVRIYDPADTLVFQRMLSLPGTPDPDAIAEPMVAGGRIELELIDHESFNAGGFSELEIEGF